VSADNGRVVVVVPIYRSAGSAERAISSIAATTPPNTPIILVDDGSNDPEVDALLTPDSLRRYRNERIDVIRNGRNLGFPGAVNAAIRSAGESDVVVVNSDVVVPAGWLERLTQAAADLPRAATLSVLANNGTMLSIPFRNDPRPDFPILSHADAVARSSAGLGPIEISNAVGHVLYLTGAAIRAVGPLDERYSPGYGEEVDFSLRAAEAGFVNYLVPGVAVHHEGSGSFGAEREALIRRNARVVQERYPYVWLRAGDSESNEATALAGLLATTSAALRPPVGHLLGVAAQSTGRWAGGAGSVTWTDDPTKADVILVPVLSELPESLHIARRQRLVVVFERTDLVTSQWRHPDARAWTRWMGRARTLCLAADAVIARDPSVVVDSGLAPADRVHELTPAPVQGGKPADAAVQRTLLLGPVDSVEFLGAAAAMVAELGTSCVVGQPVPQTWTRPLTEPGMRDGLGMSSVPGYRGHRPLNDLRAEAGWPTEALVWAPILGEVMYAAGGAAEHASTPNPLWRSLQFSDEPSRDLTDINEQLLAAMRGPMNPVRALVPTSSGGDVLFLDPPSPRIEGGVRTERAERRVGPRSVLDSLRYEGLGGSIRKTRRRLRPTR
jgi:GT2 family glycosyltransferase